MPTPYEQSVIDRHSNARAQRAEGGSLADYDSKSQREWLGGKCPKDGEPMPVYRAMRVEGEIKPGDYITNSKAYANDHLANNLGGQGIVVEISAYLDELFPADGPKEFFYLPRSLDKEMKVNLSDYETKNSKYMQDPQEKKTNFSIWFDKSTVINEDGSPKVVYHGTHGDFSQFKRVSKAHLGFHFGDIQAANLRLVDTADAYLDHGEIERCRLRSESFFNHWSNAREALVRKNPDVPMEELGQLGDDIDAILALIESRKYKPTDEEQKELDRLESVYKDSLLPVEKLGVGASIGAYYLSISRPLRMNDVGNWGSAKTIKEALPWHSEARSLKEVAEEIRARGYDGIVYANRVESPVFRSDSYIVFEPHQIKSALGNSGAFSVQSADVTDRRIEAAQKALDFISKQFKKPSLGM